MAPPAGTLRVGRYFLALLAIVAVIYGLVALPGMRHAPKLGLDLEGGKQVVFQAKTEKGKSPSKGAMSQARQIMEDRVNGSGVANAEVVVQGGNQISVAIPGKNSADIEKLGQAAQLNFRPVVMAPVGVQPASTPTTTPTGTTPTTTPSGTTPSTPASTPPTSSPAPTTSAGHSAQNQQERPLDAPTSAAATSSSGPTASGTPSPTPTSTAPAKKTATPLQGLAFAVPKSEAEFGKLPSARQQELQARLATYDCTADRPDGKAQRGQPFIACDKKAPDATLVYLLGPVIVPGTEISSATSNPPNPGVTGGSSQWTVSLNLKSSGSGAWATYTGAHNTGGQDLPPGALQSCGASGSPCADFVAFTLDGAVVSSPYNRDAINGQATQISGSFTEDSANLLARELKYGALPLSFSVLTNTDVSATLGSAQLKAGLLAGGIGLILVVLYSLVYYRALGFVTIASLLASGVLTYGCLVILGREIGFTLTLAGIAGFIVAVGITADSFVVFFERIKDEVHEGRSMRVAVPRAWVRARRTILSADTVSFLAAAVLYYFAAGDVKGFAFTLGLSTILDLVVVFLFTHPMVSMLSRSAAFGSSRFTGLSAVRAGGIVPDRSPEHAQPARHTRRAKIAAGSTRRAAAPVAVLDEDEDTTHEVQAPIDVTDDSTEPVAIDESAPEPPAEPARPPTAPKQGSAAERAAARRARLRAEAGESQRGNR